MYDGRKIFLLPFPKFHGNDFSQECPDWQDHVAGALLSAVHSRNFPKLVRLSTRRFAVVKTRHVLDLRCGDVKFVVRSPAQRVWPHEPPVRDELLDAFRRKAPVHDRVVFQVRQINAAVRRSAFRPAPASAQRFPL